MMRRLVTISLLGLAAGCSTEEPMCRLPTPHYHREAADPPWLAQAVQFHGHLGPWAAAGARAGMAGRDAVKAGGYFDVEVAAEGPFVKPPQSCFLDGLQVATGATLGKRNLTSVKSEQIVVRVKNTRTGKAAAVRPTARLIELVTSFKPRPKVGKAANTDDHDHTDHSLETIARKIASMPQKELFTVELDDR